MLYRIFCIKIADFTCVCVFFKEKKMKKKSNLIPLTKTNIHYKLFKVSISGILEVLS